MEKKTFGSLQLYDHVLLTEIKTDFRRKDKRSNLFISSAICLDDYFSVEDKLKAEQPEHRCLHGLALSYDYDKTIGEMIGRSLRKRHCTQQQ